jgi:hypothetical protein
VVVGCVFVVDVVDDSVVGGVEVVGSCGPVVGAGCGEEPWIGLTMNEPPQMRQKNYRPD